MDLEVVYRKMLGLVCLSILLPLILGQHDGYSKLRESRFFHQQHSEIPKQTNFQYSSIGSYSGSSEDSQIFSGEVSRNFIPQNGPSDKVSEANTFEGRDRYDKFQANNDLGVRQMIHNHQGQKNFDEKQKNFQERQKNFEERQKNDKFHAANSLDVRQRNNNRPEGRFNNNRLRNYEERQKDETTFPITNDLRVQHQINRYSGPSNLEERQNSNQLQKAKKFEGRERTNFASGVRNSEDKQRSEFPKKTRKRERFERKDMIHGTNEFQLQQKNPRFEEERKDERRPGRHISRPGDLRHRRPRMSSIRNRDNYIKDVKTITEIKRNPKIVKYIADKNGFAVREDLVKPLQETIDRNRQESRRRVVMAVAGSQQASRMSQVVTSAIRVAGQSGSGKFLPHIFDLKRPRQVDRLAYSLGAREVVI